MQEFEAGVVTLIGEDGPDVPVRLDFLMAVVRVAELQSESVDESRLAPPFAVDRGASLPQIDAHPGSFGVGGGRARLRGLLGLVRVARDAIPGVEARIAGAEMEFRAHEGEPHGTAFGVEAAIGQVPTRGCLRSLSGGEGLGGLLRPKPRAFREARNPQVARRAAKGVEVQDQRRPAGREQ